MTDQRNHTAPGEPAGDATGVIPHSRPTIGKGEAAAAAGVVVSGQIAQGGQVRRFEQEMVDRLGVAAAAAVSSGTAALHLALEALGAGPGSEVILPGFVCSALLNAVHLSGARPVLAEVDPGTGNIDPRDAGRRIGPATRAIIVPHMFGLPAPVREVAAFGVPVVEDCAQAVGAASEGRPVGGLGRIGIFSFYATKVMTTGEGGMVVSGERGLVERVRDLREYDRRPAYRPRFNYKMTDIQAAVGRVQLQRLDEFIRRRREIAGRYRAELAVSGIEHPPAGSGHIFFRYVVGAEGGAGRWIRHLRAAGISCSRPVHTPLHRCLGLGGYPRTDRAWRRSLSIPIFPSLERREIDRITAAFRKVWSMRRDA